MSDISTDTSGEDSIFYDEKTPIIIKEEHHHHHHYYPTYIDYPGYGGYKPTPLVFPLTIKDFQFDWMNYPTHPTGRTKTGTDRGERYDSI